MRAEDGKPDVSSGALPEIGVAPRASPARRATLIAFADLLTLAAFLAIAAPLVVTEEAGLARTGLVVGGGMAMLLLFFALGLYGRDVLYDEQVAGRRVGIAGAIALTPTVAVASFAGPSPEISGAPVALGLAVIGGLAAAFGLRLLLLKGIGLATLRRRVLMVGEGQRARRLTAFIRREFATEIAIVGSLPLPAAFDAVAIGHDPWGSTDPEKIAALARTTGADEIVVAVDERRGLPLAGLLRCKTSGLRVRDDVTFLEAELGYVDTMSITPGWIVFGDGFARGSLDRAVKRGVDVVASLILVLTTLPITLSVILLILLEGPGPIFYRQERVGRDGRHFDLVKFRTMRVDAERDGPLWAKVKDSRVTRVGRWLRRLRIDEIPQAFNVLRGEMSFVGPRPERPIFVAELARALPFYDERHRVRPGITGWAQVNYPYGASIDDAREKLAYDLYYVKHASLWLDLVILLQTLRVVLFGAGAR
jgi:sugar transferase (PEP-CTERM system associated)